MAIAADLSGKELPELSTETVYGALLAYATDPATVDYQPMHVNFGIIAPLEQKVRNKRDRYAVYADRGARALEGYVSALRQAGLFASEE